MHNVKRSSASDFQIFTAEMMNNAVGMSLGTNLYRFRALFGVTPMVCAILWKHIFEAGAMPPGSKPFHLLWALMFLKCYSTETVNKVISGADEKTFRKRSWTFVHLLSDLRVIISRKRESGHIGSACHVSVDGTDFRIREPYSFHAKWFSHKFKGPGLRYEVGISIIGGYIVWANGLFPCGAYSDLKIFQNGMKNALADNEIVIADGGYIDERHRKLGQNEHLTRLYAVIRARHETVNRCFKQFLVLGNRFRHPLLRHSACFHAVCNITEVMIEHGQPLFNV